MNGGPSPRIYSRRNLGALAGRVGLASDLAHEAEVVSLVLPFRVSDHVVEELIDWSDPAADPIYMLTFPRRGMLHPGDYAALEAALERGASAAELEVIATAIRATLNPHPAGQHELNVPDDRRRGRGRGLQHKYAETVLLFPAEGQTCHRLLLLLLPLGRSSSATDLRFATRTPRASPSTSAASPEITDVLITGGDPLIMRAVGAAALPRALLAPDLSCT